MKLLDLFERTTLPIKKGAYRSARNNYAAFLIVMNPMDFLRLTCKDDKEIRSVLRASKTDLDTYTAGTDKNFNKNQHGIPYLDVLYPSGKIRSHEGRHRAAMVHKSGGKSFSVIVYLTSDSPYETTWATSPVDPSNYDIPYEDHSEMFKTQAEAEAFAKKIGNSNDDILISSVKVQKVSGGNYTLKGHPSRSTGEYHQSAWRLEDFPNHLIGNYSDLTIPTSRMKIGLIKGHKHFIDGDK